MASNYQESTVFFRYHWLLDLVLLWDCHSLSWFVGCVPFEHALRCLQSIGHFFFRRPLSSYEQHLFCCLNMNKWPRQMNCQLRAKGQRYQFSFAFSTAFNLRIFARLFGWTSREKKYVYTQSNNSIGPVQLKYIVWIKLRCSLCGTVLLLLAERPINLTNKWILVIEPIKYWSFIKIRFEQQIDSRLSIWCLLTHIFKTQLNKSMKFD